MKTNIQNTSDEAALFNKMLEGDLRALNSFFDLYARQLYLYAMGFIHHQGEAEDMVQEVFISFWKNREKLSVTDSAWGYLMRAVRNKCVDYRLHLEVEKKYQNELQIRREEAETPADDPEELYNKVQRVIARLPEKCREVFILGCVEGLSYKEIADQTGVSVNTVKTQIKTAYKKIKSELDKEDASGALLLFGMFLLRFPE